jgi:hypothetical protein
MAGAIKAAHRVTSSRISFPSSLFAVDEAYTGGYSYGIVSDRLSIAVVL